MKATEQERKDKVAILSSVNISKLERVLPVQGNQNGTGYHHHPFTCSGGWLKTFVLT